MRTFLLYITIISFCIPAVAQEPHLKKLFEADDLQAFLNFDKSAYSDTVLFQHSLNHGAIDICSHLMAQGASANMRFDGGATALITAVNSNQPEAVSLLLSKGAEVNAQESQGLKATALMYAVSKNDRTIPVLLVEAGASLDIIDVNGDPAINWASYYGNVTVMQWLIDQGADLSIKSKHGTAEDVGLRLWHADSVMEVFRKAKPDLELSPRQSKLYKAVQSNDLYKASKLLKIKGLANTCDVLGTPLLQLAVQKGYGSMAELLLKAGADPDQMNRVGMTALAFAARFGHVDCVDLLLANGANPNQTGEQYQLTALMGAAIAGDIGIAQRLIKAGADLEVIDKINQGSALLWALFYRHQDFAIWLLSNGVDYKSKVLEGAYTLRSAAEILGANEVAQWIDERTRSEHPLLGSWKMSEIHYIREDTVVQVKPVLQGRMTFSDRNYHLIYNPWINERTAFKKLSQPTNEEMIRAFQSLVFNSGTYTYTDSTVVAIPDVAKVPGFEGGTQYYTYIMKGEELHITMYDETYPDGTKPEWYQKLKVLFKLVKE